MLASFQPNYLPPKEPVKTSPDRSLTRPEIGTGPKDHANTANKWDEPLSMAPLSGEKLYYSRN